MFLKAFYRHGEKLQMWLTKLKIAIVEKNTDELSRLMENIPELEGIDKLTEAVYLLREATELVYTLQNESAASMNQIKKNLDFLKSTAEVTLSKLDITS